MKLKMDSFSVPVATLFLGLLFCAVYSFKLGEAYFYDYPSYYIYLNIPDVINVALKVVLIYSILLAMYIALLTWDGAGFSFLIATCLLAIIKLFLMAKLYKSGQTHTLVYVNVGMTYLLCAALGLFLNKSFVRNESVISVNYRFAFLTFIVFLSLNFFIGLNYHSFFPKSTWQTEDGKILVGTYKDSLLFRQCFNGKSFFYLEEAKEQKLEMFEIDTRGVLTLRCLSR